MLFCRKWNVFLDTSFILVTTALALSIYKLATQELIDLIAKWNHFFFVSPTASRVSTCLWKGTRSHTRYVPSPPRTRSSKLWMWWSPTWIQAPSTRPGLVRSSAPRSEIFGGGRNLDFILDLGLSEAWKVVPGSRQEGSALSPSPREHG